MATLSDIGLDPAELSRQIEIGNVRVQSHPNLPLFIYNYTEKCQFDKRWNDYTLACRGLICDADGVVLARPWKKFFNLGEGYAEFDWDSPVEVTDKMDGSLGILYSFDAGVGLPLIGIATRGSFDSDQARHANSVWAVRYSNLPDMNWAAVNDFTFLFEIIYPANRIVLNYHGLDDLVLLGAVNIEYGYYVGPREAQGILNWPGPVTEVFEYRTLREAFANCERPNAEGYVVRSGNKLVKIKQVDYVELHRIVTNLNDRTIWEMLKTQSPEQICVSLPDEFHEYVKRVAEELSQACGAKCDEIIEEYTRLMLNLPVEYNRKDFAEAVQKSPNKKYLFMLLDKKPIVHAVWDTLKPSVSKE